MAKTIRLYRLETPGGKGLYAGDPDLGTRVGFEIETDRDIYLENKSSEQWIKTRDGRFRRWYMLLPSNNTYSRTLDEQLSLFPISEDSFGTPVFQLDLNGENNSSLSGTFGASPYRMYDPSDYGQLELDVTLPVVVMRRKTRQYSPMSLIDVLNTLQEPSNTYRNHRPLPDDDGIDIDYDDIVGKYHFAFRTFEQLSNWVALQPKTCLTAGAVIKVIDVKCAKHGNSQSIYRKKHVVREFAIRHI